MAFLRVILRLYRYSRRTDFVYRHHVQVQLEYVSMFVNSRVQFLYMYKWHSFGYLRAVYIYSYAFWYSMFAYVGAVQVQVMRGVSVQHVCMCRYSTDIVWVRV